MSKIRETFGSRIGVSVALVVMVALAVGWVFADRAAAAPKIRLSKLVDLDQIPVGLDSGPANWTHTLYVTRVNGTKMTLAINELHALMAERGWLYLEMMPHLEDGDLKGMWLVYRALGWGPQPESASSRTANR